ncbi:MAG: LamG domain-containing protein [Planctomycetes bacterium]|nr:LamG domain-containing protein [Planctomycetota bacterium]
MSKQPIKLACFVFMLSQVLTIAGIAAEKPNLVGWWKFDEGSGTIAVDSSGNDVQGTLVSDPLWRDDGVHNGCLFFDGDQAHVRITHQDSLNPADGSFTAMFWAYLETTPGTSGSTNWDLAVNKRDSGSVGYYIGADRNQGNADQSGYRFMLGDIDANRKDTPFVTVPLGEWVFVTAVLDRDQNQQKISVDAGQTWATTIPPPGPVEPAQDLGIGWDIGLSNYWFHGRIDNVLIYDLPLSVPEILAVMEGGGDGYPLALRPDPADGALLEDTWTNLSWIPGSFALSHDVYFGTSFDDVNDGTDGTFVGNINVAFQAVGFQGFPAPDGLIPGTTYYWRIDEVNDADPNSPWKGDIWSFTIPSKKAYNPYPPDGVKYVDPNVTLNWTAGFDSKLHTVYFSEIFDDVNNASAGIPQTATTYRPFFGPLDLDKIYYWRVDEYDAVTTHKGNIWSFRTKPFIPIVDPNLIGWWTFDEGFGSTALDWSGHGNDCTLVDNPEWVEGHTDGALEFNGSNYITMNDVADDITSNDITLSGWVKTTDSHGLWLSSNTATGNVALWSIDQGRAAMYDGADSAYEGYSNTAVNDNEWHMLTYVRSGSTGYIYVDGVQENTHPADYSFSPTDRWSIAMEWDSGTPSDFLAGIVDDVRIYDKALTADEVQQLMRGDPLVAWDPGPRNKSTVDIKEAREPLRWSPGDEAAQHDIYFGTDKEAVSNADTSDTTGIYRGRQAAANYTLNEEIEWGGGPYFWRIDEYNNDTSISTGTTWSFTVADYLTVDDFESYNDLNEDEPDSNRIFYTWIDGFDNPAINGSIVGYANPPFAEQTIVHSDRQSMPFAYDNGVGISEATSVLTDMRDWTTEGVGILSLWFFGDPSNVAEPMYAALNGNAVVSHDDPDAALINTWTQWTIDLTLFADQGVNLANVNSITLGLGNKNNPVAGGAGLMFFDDIRLYAPIP